MSFTPEPGTPLAAVLAQTQPRIGAVLSRRSLGTLDAVTIGRYAMTIGAADPSHYDPAAARSAGTPTWWRHRTCSPRSSSGVSAPPRPSFSPTEPRTTETCPSVTATWGCA
jgi:hypothetical protein